MFGFLGNRAPQLLLAAVICVMLGNYLVSRNEVKEKVNDLDTRESRASNIHKPFSQDAVRLRIVDRVLEPQTIAAFLAFLTTGVFPSGRKLPESELLDFEDIELLVGPPNADGLSATEEDSLIRRVMDHIGSHEDTTALLPVSRAIFAIKSRVWEGIAPMSRQRWRERQLYHPKRHAAAIQHLAQVVRAFQYLNSETTQQALCQTYNNIYDRFAEASSLVSAQAKARGARTTDTDLAALWADYIEDLFGSSAQRAHMWVTSNIDELIKANIATLRSHTHDSVAYPADPPYDAVQWAVSNRLHDLLELSFRSDVSIVLRTHGYKGCSKAASEWSLPEPDSGDDPKLRSKSENERLSAYAANVKQYSRILHLGDSSVNGLPLYHPDAILSAYNSQLEARELIKNKLQCPTKELGPEPWMQALLLRWKPGAEPDLDKEGNTIERYPNWGFVAYRLTHGQSDSDWKAFQDFVKRRALGWQEGTEGADSIAGRFEIHWLDGQELGLEDGHLASARAHFKAFVAAPENKLMFTTIHELREEAAIVIDKESWDSYIRERDEGIASAKAEGSSTTVNSSHDQDGTVLSVNTSATLAKQPALGTTGTFVTLIDVDWDPSVPDERGDESPDYPGQLRVLPSLLISDVYAMYAANTQDLWSLWPLAMRHPQQLYIGPVARDDEAEWAPLPKLGWVEWLESHAYEF